MEHTIEEKLEAIGLVKSGLTPRAVSQKLHLGHHSLYEWLAAYEKNGVSGLKNNYEGRKKRTSFEEKRRIILECQDSELPLYQIALKNGIAEATLNAWLSKARLHGIESLATPKKVKESGIVMTRHLPKDEYEKENERLRKENERLRAEVLLLKKVKALVEEREARNRRIGRGPSKN